MMITRILLSGLFSLSTTFSASAQGEPSPPLGQIVAWKWFPPAASAYHLPSSSVSPETNSGPWFVTTFPSKPNFTELYSNTGLWCFVMLDVIPSTTNGINMAIVIDDGSKWRVQQALTGQPNQWLTFSFGFVWGDVTAGAHQVTIQMQSFDGSGAIFSAAEANLECFEMVLPPSQ
jgi:hypothetical protein